MRAKIKKILYHHTYGLVQSKCQSLKKAFSQRFLGFSALFEFDLVVNSRIVDVYWDTKVFACRYCKGYC